MTREVYQRRSRYIVLAVNIRRATRGRQPLREAHIMRAVRLVLGKEPPMQHPSHARSGNRGDLSSLEHAVLFEVACISDATLQSWIDRGFSRVEKLARAALRLRAAKGASNV